MSITNYNQLKEAVESKWTHRTDLVSHSADFITLGESYLNRKLRCREMEERATITPDTTNNYVALPDGFMELISFTDDLGDDLTEVSAVELENLRYANDATRPQCYRITNRIDFERVADTTYSFPMWHFKRLDLATDLTNDVLTAHPDIYLFASLVQAEAFIKNDPRIALWKSGLVEAIEDQTTSLERTNER